MYKYSTELKGSLEDLYISEITLPTNPLRSTNNIEELAESISRIGLLQPIVVRTNRSEGLEVVAGNRRLNACKSLGWKKIACHVVELDDRAAFEVSIIENVQRHTLNPIEEGIAFRKYVSEFGWGGISELAEKLSKSTSYICKRIKLTELPKDIVELISTFEISVSTGEELLPVADEKTQIMLKELVQRKHLSSRTVRNLVRKFATKNPHNDTILHFTSIIDYEKIHRIFDKIIISLKLLIKKLVTIIESVEDKWIFYDILMQHKHMLHQQIDLLIKEKRKYKKYARTLVR